MPECALSDSEWDELICLHNSFEDKLSYECKMEISDKISKLAEKYHYITENGKCFLCGEDLPQKTNLKASAGILSLPLCDKCKRALYYRGKFRACGYTRNDGVSTKMVCRVCGKAESRLSRGLCRACYRLSVLNGVVETEELKEIYCRSPIRPRKGNQKKAYERRKKVIEDVMSTSSAPGNECYPLTKIK